MKELATTAPTANHPDPVMASVAALALPGDGAEHRWNIRTATAAWLASRKSEHTRRAYFRDLADWTTWCEQTNLDPRDAKRGDVDAYVMIRCDGLSPTSTARRLSVISSWYSYLASNEITEKNPVVAVDRPEVNHDHSPTVGLTGRQIGEFMRATRTATGPAARRDTALLAMLAELGLRVGEALRLDTTDLRHNRGHRTVTITGKGGKRRELPIPAPLARDLDAYLDQRADREGIDAAALTGPLFTTNTGKRVDQPAVFRLVRRIGAAASIPGADQLSPHSLRHTAATAALDAGAPLRDVQDMLGHADPRTTRRYDRSRGNLDRSPVYAISGLFTDV